MIEFFQMILMWIGIIYFGGVLFGAGAVKLVRAAKGEKISNTDAMIVCMWWPLHLCAVLASFFR